MSNPSKADAIALVKMIHPDVTHIHEVPEMGLLLVFTEISPGLSNLGFANGTDEYFLMADPSGAVMKFVDPESVVGWNYLAIPNANLEKAGEDFANLLVNHWDTMVEVAP